MVASLRRSSATGNPRILVLLGRAAAGIISPMVDRRPGARAIRDVERLAASAANPDRYFETLACALAEHGVPSVGACWHLTEPSSGLATWIGYRGELPGDLASAVENEYLEDDVAKYVDLAGRGTPVAALVSETGGRPAISARYRHHLAPGGFADELRMVFADGFGQWGSMGLFNDAAYDDREQAVAAAVVMPVARALREAIARSRSGSDDAPGVIVLDGDDRVRSYDDRASELLTRAVNTGTLPGAVHILAARARATSARSRGRTLGDDGAWIDLNATNLTDGSVAIVLRPAPPASIIELRLRAAGLTAREREITLCLLRGESTATIAATLHLSPWTVQDHLKAIFDKTGVRSRRAFVARWALEAASGIA